MTYLNPHTHVLPLLYDRLTLSYIKNENQMLKLSVAKKRLCAAICSLIIAILFGALFTPVVSAEEPYRKNLIIGFVGPVTGDESQYGKPIAEGITLAAEEFNKAGGINGEKIEVLIRDNMGALGETNAALDEFVQKKVTAIIASPSGWTTFAPVSVANRTWTIFMSVGTQRHIGKSGPFVFRNCLSDDIAIDASIKYSTEKLGYKRYALITSMVDDEATLEAAGFYKKALQKYGGEIVVEEFTNFDIGLSDAVSMIKKAATGSVDAVIYAGNDQNGAELLKELRKQGVNAPLVGGEGLKTSNFLKRSGKAAIGTILYTSFTTLSKDKKSQAFTKNYRAATGRYPDPLAALGYDSFMLIAEALKRAGTTEPMKVVDSLKQIKDHPGVSCPVSVDEHGETIYSPHILKVVMGSKGPVFQLAQ